MTINYNKFIINFEKVKREKLKPAAVVRKL